MDDCRKGPTGHDFNRDAADSSPLRADFLSSIRKRHDPRDGLSPLSTAAQVEEILQPPSKRCQISQGRPSHGTKAGARATGRDQGAGPLTVGWALL